MVMHGRMRVEEQRKYLVECAEGELRRSDERAENVIQYLKSQLHQANTEVYD